MAALTDAEDKAFETAAEVARSLTPSTDDRLRLYGLYKHLHILLPFEPNYLDFDIYLHISIVLVHNIHPVYQHIDILPNFYYP